MWDFRKMVFFTAMATHSRNFPTRFMFLIREHNTCLEKGDKVLCLLSLWVLPQALWGEDVRRFFFEDIFMGAPDILSPIPLHPSESGGV